MIKMVAHLTLAIVFMSHLINARLLRERRTVGNVQEEDRTFTESHHRIRHHQGRPLITVRDYTDGNVNEDRMAHATTRVIASLPDLDLNPTEPRDAVVDTNRQDERGLTDQSTVHLLGSGFTDSTNSTNATYFGHSNCTACIIRDEMKRIRIKNIKDEILRKLRLEAPPNITARRIPSIPLIQTIREKYEMQKDAPYSMMADSPYEGGEPDDYHARTMKVLNFATPGKLLFLFIK